MLGRIGRSLITTGVVVLLFVVFQLWGTNVLESRAQDDLRDEFDNTLFEAQTRLAEIDRGEPAPIDAGDATPVSVDETDVETTAPPTTSTLPGGFDPEVLAFFFPEDGDAVARIEIPAIGLDKIVVSGVQVVDLRKGPGQYPGTAQVGTEGNTAIAGHRTTYGAPFNRIDELQPGDEIRITSILGSFTYEVMTPEAAFPDRLSDIVSQGNGHIIVRPDATWVLDNFGENRVTLTACHPKFSARRRIIVAAELVQAPTPLPDFDPAMVAAAAGGGPETPQLPGEQIADPGEDVEAREAETDPASVIPSSTAEMAGTSVTLDEGLRGERSAIPGAIAWMVAAAAIWGASGVIGTRRFDRRSHRIAVRLVGLVPAATFMWFSFEMIDRALPAA